MKKKEKQRFQSIPVHRMSKKIKYLLQQSSSVTSNDLKKYPFFSYKIFVIQRNEMKFLTLLFLFVTSSSAKLTKKSIEKHKTKKIKKIKYLIEKPQLAFSSVKDSTNNQSILVTEPTKIRKMCDKILCFVKYFIK